MSESTSENRDDNATNKSDAAKQADVKFAQEPVPPSQPAAARRRSAGAGAVAGGFRARLLEALKKVEDGDTLIEGTEVGERQLEKFMRLLDKIENGERGRKLKDKAQELLSPVETEEGFHFSPEGVKNLVAFLEQEPDRQAGARRRAAAGRAGGRRAGGSGAPMSRRPGARLR